MEAKFEVEFLDEALEFLEGLENKDRVKILYNIDKSRRVNDPKLFKKLDDDIWEFRTKFAGKQYRMLAFWTKRKGKLSLVITTHGFVKKMSKVSKSEIKKAQTIRINYLKNE